MAGSNPTANEKTATPTTTLELSKPAEIGDKKLSVLELNFDGLTGGDLCQAEREFVALNPGFVGVPSLTSEFTMLLAANLFGCPVDDIKALPIRDCSKLIREVDNFLS